MQPLHGRRRRLSLCAAAQAKKSFTQCSVYRQDPPHICVQPVLVLFHFIFFNCLQFMLQHCYSLLLLCKNRLPDHHFGRASSKFSRIRIHSPFSKLTYSLRRASSQKPPSCICFETSHKKVENRQIKHRLWIYVTILHSCENAQLNVKKTFAPRNSRLLIKNGVLTTVDCIYVFTDSSSVISYHINNFFLFPYLSCDLVMRLKCRLWLSADLPFLTAFFFSLKVSPNAGVWAGVVH